MKYLFKIVKLVYLYKMLEYARKRHQTWGLTLNSYIMEKADYDLQMAAQEHLLKWEAEQAKLESLIKTMS